MNVIFLLKEKTTVFPRAKYLYQLGREVFGLAKVEPELRQLPCHSSLKDLAFNFLVSSAQIEPISLFHLS